jgi:surfeit locus 1 family protein
MNPRARGLLWPAVVAALAFSLLLGLGFWQMRRLAWKEALIARIETRANKPVVELPPHKLWPTLSSNDYDFEHVRLSGNFDLAREALIFSPPPRDMGVEPGYLVLTPFVVDNGGVVLVNRGFIPQSYARSDARKHSPQGHVTVTGLMRAPQPRNLFTPDDDPERGLWFTSDPAKIAKSLSLSEAAPFTVTLDPQGAPDRLSHGLPQPFASEPNLANNHFSYALTWFALAAALAVTFLFYAHGALKPPDSIEFNEANRVP